MTSDRPYRAPCRRPTRAPSSARRRRPVLPAHGRRAARRARRRPGAPAREPDLPTGTAQSESELRALIAVAGAVAAAHRLEDVLEVVAEETRRVVGASSVSISRWEREHERVRTLINVGELGPDEERFPIAETYELADYARRAAAARGRVVRGLARRPGPRAADRQLLDALEKGSYIGVPVIFDGRTWGKLEAFANVGAVPFTRRHVPFLEAIAGQVGAAIGRAELFSRVNALAYADPLTGLGNRRALDDRLEPAAERGGPSWRSRSATSTASSGSTTPRATRPATARSGAPPTRSPPPRREARRLGVPRRRRRVLRRARGRRRRGAAALAAEGERRAGGGDDPLSLSCGAAALLPGTAPADLFRAADAAQYAAKRPGPGRVVVAGDERRRAAPATTGARTAIAPTTRRARSSQQLLATLGPRPRPSAPAPRPRAARARPRRDLRRESPAAPGIGCPGWTSSAARAVPGARAHRVPQQRHRRPAARGRGRRRARGDRRRRSARPGHGALRAALRAAGPAARRVRAARRTPTRTRSR